MGFLKIYIGGGAIVSVQLNQFETALLDYIYRNPGTSATSAIDKNHIERASGHIAIRYLTRLGLIMADGSPLFKPLTITPNGLKILGRNGTTS